MKVQKISFKIFLGLFILGMTIGCSKEESSLNNEYEPNSFENESISSVNKGKNPIMNNKSGDIDTTYIAFVDSATWKLALVNFCDSFFTLHIGTIDISYDLSTQLNMLVTNEVAHLDTTSTGDVDKIVCSGEKSNVVSCANRYAANNMFGCAVEVKAHKCGCGHYEGRSIGDPPC